MTYGKAAIISAAYCLGDHVLLSGKSVLVVEDAALIAVDIETMLDELGAARVVTAGGGETALPIRTDAGAFDIAIVDVHTARRFSGDHFRDLDQTGVPVVFLVTNPESTDLLQFKGQHEVVGKPFTYEDLCAAIVRLIG